MNPFDLPGPEFLVLYVGVFIVAAGFAAALRWVLRGPGDEPPAEALDLSPYEVTYLAGGARLAIDAAMVRLIHRGALQIDASSRRLAQRVEQPPEGLHPLERAVFAAAGPAPGTLVPHVRRAVDGTAAKLRDRLDELGVLLPGGMARGISMVSAGVIAAVALFGLIKLCVGLARERPVSILAVFLVFTAVIAFGLLIKRPFRTRRGDALLGQMRREHAALQTTADRRADALADTDLLLAMGLFGMGVLAGSSLAPVRTALLLPPIVHGTGGGHTCGGADGGGGGGCGGGGGGCGGGGGGCGGCGGGGN